MGQARFSPFLSCFAPYLGRAIHVLGGVGLVVHEEELDVLDVADKESLVARGHHVAGLLVGAIADLEVCNRQR